MFIEDIRENGMYLRTTWHPERRLFVVSTWSGEVCTGAVRLRASEAPELVSLLVDGLAESSSRRDATAAGAATGAAPPGTQVGPHDADGRPQDAPPSSPGRRPAGLPDWRTIRRWLRHRTGVPAPILPFGRPAARPDAVTPDPSRAVPSPPAATPAPAARADTAS